jgi:hypothetical protein
MIKKVFLIISFISIFSFNCYAEGQDGIASLFNIVYYIWAFMCISIYAIIGGIIIKLILYKSNLLLENQTLKAFSISFLLAILASLIFGEGFLYFVWNCL